MANAFTAAAAKATAANEERYSQGMGLWDEIIKRYQPGGGYGAGALASYERGKTGAVGAGMQQLVSSGLANTTVAATIGKKYEEEVGTPFKLQLQDVQSQRLSEAQAGKAGFIERRTDAYPDPGLAASLGSQVGYAQGMQAGGYGQQDSGPSPWDPDFLGGGWGVSTPWGRNVTSRSGGGTTAGGGGGGTGRTGGGGGFTSTYNPAGLNMEQLGGPATYGEPGGPAGPPLPEGFSPTGTGGEAKAPGPQYEGDIWYLQRAAGFGEGREGYKKWEASLNKQAKAPSKVGTTSYAAKGGGFGGRGF